jgi:site-specific DNA recombinase
MIDQLTGLFGVPAGANAAIYTRVSSEMQLAGHSLQAQLDECISLAKQKKWNVIAHYTDEAISGKTTERPAFQQMLADAEAGKFQVIIIHKLDRLTRSLTDLLLTMHAFDQADVRVISATELFDFTSPIGKVILALLGALAQWYLDNLATEIRKGYRARARAGHWIAQVPTGYCTKYKKDGGDSLALIHEEEAEGIKLAFQTYAKGAYSDRDIALLLNEYGYRTKGGKLWSRDSINFILQNSFYIGKVAFKGEEFEGLHEPLIPQELFEQCQQVRSQRRAKRTDLSQNRKQRIYLLKGLTYCDRCGAKFHISTSKLKRGPKPQFFCSARRQTKTCDQPYIDLLPIEDEIEEMIKQISLPPDWQEQIRSQVEAHIENKGDNNDKQRVTLNRQLERLKKMFYWGDIPEDEYRRQAEEIKTKLALSPIQPITSQAPDLERLAEIIQNLDVLWTAANRKEKRQIVQSLIKEIHLEHQIGITKLVWTDELNLILP